MMMRSRGMPEKDFETIQIVLAEEPNQKSTILHLKPQQYMSWKGCVADECNLICLSLLPDEKADDPNLVASIGGFGMQGYLVVHDTDRGRIGWMESDCKGDEFRN
ncbi:hypothetical protein KC19_6G150100 [Ceratodon purpureus]|uniref:Peptidase A1 domain-containing protein n=1 Tax=Ceratodon purpureus TaxID=3225 RepID=A0A8T0HI70_CERPU|nr:hypothetical protein KC19_6G150100 [Ceratodon purpureus]